eukprot:m.106738 g.106738  ORF g.106738 m.106738 type:complete len:98 (+) comp12717_c1_seq2:1654-1947(+)
MLRMLTFQNHTSYIFSCDQRRVDRSDYSNENVVTQKEEDHWAMSSPSDPDDTAINCPSDASAAAPASCPWPSTFRFAAITALAAFSASRRARLYRCR